MKRIIFLGFLIFIFHCELTRHSGDVLERKKIFIEGHRGVSNGQKNHNTKEAILNSIDKGIESIEIDAWLTKDKKVVIFHDLDKKIYSCKNKDYEGYITFMSQDCYLTYSQLQECKTKEGNYTIPLLEDIIDITKGKIFMNLELKGSNLDLWAYVRELIEKYEYYDQISISSFNHDFYYMIEKYNNDYKRKIVFGFLYLYSLDINYMENHQISLDADQIKIETVTDAHNRGMTVGAYFLKEPKDLDYYYLFEMGVDVIITDYPERVANQSNEFMSDKIFYEGCSTFSKTNFNITSCTSCIDGYKLVKVKEQGRNLCKLNYELVHFDLYKEKSIYAIKMLYSPFGNKTICQKNGKTIFYFEWSFDLYGYDGKKYIISNRVGYGQLTEIQIKLLDFSEIEIYVDKILINQKDFLCKDLYDLDYFSTYRVMGAHCYFIYHGEKKSSYNVQFRLFDDNYISFVTYNNKYLSNYDSWRKSDTINFYSSNSDTICNNIKDPFEERISCINKIKNCMYCENENSCQKCKNEYSLFNGKCESSTIFENNLKYFTPDNGKNYYTCSSIISNCEECSYKEYSFNKFHCSKCSNGLILNEAYECIKDDINKFYDSIVITSNFNKKIKSGDKIEFKIKQIQQNKYKLNNDEIIFEDALKTRALYFKSCKKNPTNGIITSITCKVSKNIIKGEYTVLSDGQNISIQPGNNIKFIVDDSIGGMLIKGVSKTYDYVNQNLDRIVLEMLYIHPNIHPGYFFPYTVYLLGNKRNTTRLRNLEEIYEYNISFPNCSVVSYLDEEKSAFGNISCYMPDYIPAGTYSKLQSEGFDISPNCKINIVFMNDYNASKFNNNAENIPEKRKSSSNYKAWLIWLIIVIAIALLIIAGIIIIICILRRKGKKKYINEANKF